MTKRSSLESGAEGTLASEKASMSMGELAFGSGGAYLI
jgi:hypothetical protein